MKPAIDRSYGSGGREVTVLRILVVDPYAPGRETLCTCVAELGHAASGARDVHEAAKLLDQKRVDLLVVDHAPPWNDGWRTVEVLRCKAWIPAIVLLEIEAPPIGVALTLLKPVSLVELECAIAAVRCDGLELTVVA